MDSYRFQVKVPAVATYDVVIEPGCLDRAGEIWRRRFRTARAIIVTDDRVARLFEHRLTSSLASERVPYDVCVVPEGEPSKSVATFARLLDQLAERGADRRSIVLNLGGGVISDLGGYVAASYMRGIRYVNISTSMIGQVDASVGGKVAVNARVAKNLIGAFHHPSLVLSDPSLLRTLSARDFRSGIAEAIKVGVIACPKLFAELERDQTSIESRDAATLTEMIGRATEVKMRLVGQDPYEEDLRRPLNFGHTLGHPIETEFAYHGIRHGEAVSIGMLVATMIARRRSLDGAVAERILELIRSYGLPGLLAPIPVSRVLDSLRYVRMIRGNRLHFVLPAGIGRVEITESVTPADLERGFADYHAWAEVERRHGQSVA